MDARDERTPLVRDDDATRRARSSSLSTRSRVVGGLAIAATIALGVVGRAPRRVALGANERTVTFTVDAGCPPEEFRLRKPGFFEKSVVSVRLLTKCPPQVGGDWTFKDMSRIPATKQYSTTATVADECEYGFALVNEDGDEMYDVGGDNVDVPLKGGECITPTPAGGNLYWNRRVSSLNGANSVKWAWGHCQEECPILCKIIALSDEDENNVYSVLERDKDEIWHRAEGKFKTVHAGYNDLWAVKEDDSVHITTIDALDIKGSSWRKAAATPGALKSIDVGLEEAYFVRTDNKYYAKPANDLGSWRVMPGGLKHVAVGKEWLFGLTWSSGAAATSNWVWACELPCTGRGIHTNFPENRTPRQCEVSLEYVFCTSDTNKVYRTGARLSWFKNGKDGAKWGWPTTRPASVWELVPNIEAKMVTVGDYNVWAIDTDGTLKFCAQPCATGNWIKPTGVPKGIVYIDASKYN